MSGRRYLILADFDGIANWDVQTASLLIRSIPLRRDPQAHKLERGGISCVEATPGVWIKNFTSLRALVEKLTGRTHFCAGVSDAGWPGEVSEVRFTSLENPSRQGTLQEHFADRSRARGSFPSISLTGFGYEQRNFGPPPQDPACLSDLPENRCLSRLQLPFVTIRCGKHRKRPCCESSQGWRRLLMGFCGPLAPHNARKRCEQSCFLQRPSSGLASASVHPS